MTTPLPMSEAIEQCLDTCPRCETQMQVDILLDRFICPADDCQVSAVYYIVDGEDIVRTIHRQFSIQGR